MVELAAIGPEAGEAGAPLCESIPLELPLVVLLEGVRMLVFFRTGVTSFQVIPPLGVDSRRPSLKEAHPCEVSLKCRPETAAVFGTSAGPLAAVSVALPAKPNLMRVRPEGPESFGAMA